jgi:UDP-glucose 4-epimerase
MKIAITGARGRLARVLRGHFAAAGDEVLAFSRYADEAHASLEDLPALLEWGEVDAVLHLAWSTVPATAEQMPGVEQREDLPLLSSLLSALRGRGRPHFVFFSTGAVYGEPRPGQVFSEHDTPTPKGRYAAGKVAAEKMTEEFRGTHGVKSCVLRVTNPYGFAQGQQSKQGVIPAMLVAAKNKTEFTAWGTGDALKDYLHIDDLCVAVDVAVRNRLAGIFNVAAGASLSLNEVAAMVEAASGRPLKIRHIEAQPWDVQGGRYSNEAFVGATGWSPRVDFAEGLARFARRLGDSPPAQRAYGSERGQGTAARWRRAESGAGD